MIKKLTRADLEFNTFTRSYFLPKIAMYNGYVVEHQSSSYKVGDAVDYSEELRKFIDYCSRNTSHYDTILIGKSANLALWKRDFESLKESEQWMIRVAVPEVWDNPDLQAINWVGKCLSIATTRIRKQFGVPCERCGGSGEYSYNHRDGRRCYGCGGTGKKLPRLTKKKMAEIEAYFNEQYAKKREEKGA